MRGILSISIQTNHEWQGELLRAGTRQYFYTSPREATEARGTGVWDYLVGFDGWYHSHGADSHGVFEDERFSNPRTCPRNGDRKYCDTMISDDTGKPGYLITPSGRMKRYDADPKRQCNGKITEIGRTDP